jgi:hypothetical protein
MPAPRQVKDALECVLSVFFSSARHNLRAAFILCDELVEITCRERAKRTQPNLGRLNFPALLRFPAVALDPKVNALGVSLLANHETRNAMQHVSSAITVDSQHCADAILDAVEAIEHCFGGSKAALPGVLLTALRGVQLLSSQGDAVHRIGFTRAMQLHPWRGTTSRPKAPRLNEAIISPGNQEWWGLSVWRDSASVNAMLSRVGAATYP